MITIPTRQELVDYISLTPPERRAVNKDPHIFLLFFSYYFCEAIKYPFASFHADFANDLVDLYDGVITQLVWCTARETAKSAFASGWLLWLIVNSKDDYFNVDSYDGANSEGFTFDVSNHLLTNPRILADYGKLYPGRATDSEKTRARVGDFTIPTSNVRVEAHTTNQPVRGRRHDIHIRPSWIIMDDFETMTTVRSEADTRNVRQHISEFATGLDQKKMRIIYLCNWLSDAGNVAMLKEKSLLSPKTRFREVWRTDKITGLPTWPERDVLTDAELKLEGNENKVSIESKRLEMRTKDYGDSDWEREMMGNPFSANDFKFRKDLIQTITKKEVQAKRTAAYLLIDPPGMAHDAKSAADNSKDYCGWSLVRVDLEDNWHVESWRDRPSPKRMVDMMFELWLSESLVAIGIEDTQFWQGMKVFVQSEEARRNIRLNVKELKHRAKSKEERIMALLPRYESHSIFHVEEKCRDLEIEQSVFPYGQHDDALDSLAMALEVCRPPGQSFGSVVQTKSHFRGFLKRRLPR